jgi:type VI secretion system protein ImpM
MAQDGRIGLFGKLPAHGDFVRRGLPSSFVQPWDAWLSEGIAQARPVLGRGWDAAWKGAPVWRFRLSPGACGPGAAVGVVTTSADQVGRKFPLTLVAVLPNAAVPPPDSWYAALEQALLEARAGALDADALAEALPPPPADDPDATLDGRNLFWTAGQPALMMPGSDEFTRLLGPADVPEAEPVAEPPAAAVTQPKTEDEPAPTWPAPLWTVALPFDTAPSPDAETCGTSGP